MMTDREMLELAAKASGMRLLLSLGFTSVDEAFFDEETRREWNPLIDDGDALRLAVKLDFCISNWSKDNIPHVMVGYKKKKKASTTEPTGLRSMGQMHAQQPAAPSFVQPLRLARRWPDNC